MSRSIQMTMAPGFHCHLVLQASERRALFSKPQDYAALEETLSQLVKRGAIAVHAYCWRRRSLHLAIELKKLTLDAFVRAVSNCLNSTFRSPPQAMVIEPASGLLRLIRLIHLEPVRSGLVRNPADYRLSSHSAYLGEVTVPWLTTSLALEMLDRDPQQARRLYERLMQTRSRAQTPQPSPPANERRAPQSSLEPPVPTTQVLNSIVDSVTQKLHVDRESVFSDSRRRLYSMARALIAWEATRRHVATLSEVGRVLHRDPSTLCTGIQRYRELRPELFGSHAAR